MNRTSDSYSGSDCLVGGSDCLAGDNAEPEGPDPADCTCGILVNEWHQGYSLRPLLDIGLIDTKGVYPEKAMRLFFAELEKAKIEIIRNFQSTALTLNSLRLTRVSPYERERFIWLA